MTILLCEFMNSYWSPAEMNPYLTSKSLLTQDLRVRSLGSSGRSLLDRLELHGVDLLGASRADEFAEILQSREPVFRQALEEFLEWTPVDDGFLLIGLVALAPELDHAASRLSAGNPGDDAISELLAHATVALRWTHELRGGERVNFVLQHAFTRTRAEKRRVARHNVPACSLRASDDTASVAASWDHHPEGLLAHAVEQCVMTAEEARLIDLTRVRGVTLSQLAREQGVTYAALHQRRLRAEERLRRYFTPTGAVR